MNWRTGFVQSTFEFTFIIINPRRDPIKNRQRRIRKQFAKKLFFRALEIYEWYSKVKIYYFFLKSTKIPVLDQDRIISRRRRKKKSRRAQARFHPFQIVSIRSNPTLHLQQAILSTIIRSNLRYGDHKVNWHPFLISGYQRKTKKGVFFFSSKKRHLLRRRSAARYEIEYALNNW